MGQQQQLQEQQQQEKQQQEEQQQKKQLQIQQQQQQLQEQQQQEKQQQEEQHQQQQQHQQQLTSPLNETGSVRPQQFPKALNDNDRTTDMRNSYQLNNTGIKNVADISNSARRLSNNIGGNLGLGGFPNNVPKNNTFGRINSLGGENEHYLNHIQNEPLGNNKQFGSNNLDGHNNNNNQTGMVNNFNIPNNSGVP